MPKRRQAKEFLTNRSNLARHAHNGNRHHFFSTIYAAVNDSATLNDLQQSVAALLIEETYNEVDQTDVDENFRRRRAVEIATYLNSCHE